MESKDLIRILGKTECSNPNLLALLLFIERRRDFAVKLPEKWDKQFFELLQDKKEVGIPLLTGLSEAIANKWKFVSKQKYNEASIEEAKINELFEKLDDLLDEIELEMS